MSNSKTDLSHGSLVSQAEGRGSKELCELGTFLISFVLTPRVLASRIEQPTVWAFQSQGTSEYGGPMNYTPVHLS